MKSQVVKNLARHIREVYFGVNWTWSNLKDNLEDVTWEQATTKIDSLNTIIGLTYHIHYYVASLVSVVSGGPLIGKDKYSFDHPPINSQQDWDDFLTLIFKEAEELAALVETLDEDSLWSTFGVEKYGNFYRNIHGFVEHAHYHLGQIVIIKKLVKKPGFMV